jgi:hypothetical protein
MKKFIIIGAPNSGKTTQINILRSKYNLHILELDEELVKLNDGKWPGDYKYRNLTLLPKVIENISSLDEAIFFTSYFDIPTLSRLKLKGYKILLIQVPELELLKRNESNIGTEWDKSSHIKDNLKYQEDLINSNLIDNIINGLKSPDDIAFEIYNHTN